MFKVGETVVIDDKHGRGGMFHEVRAVITRVPLFGGSVTVTVPTAFGDNIELKLPPHKLHKLDPVKRGLVNA